MRMLRISLLMLGIAAMSYAADPFAGIWKMNVAKSKYTVGTGPKEQTVTIMEMGSDLHVTVNGTAPDGSKIAMDYTLPAGGGPGKMNPGGAYDGVASKRTGPSEREVIYMKSGKTVYTTHSKVSADGKTLQLHSKGTNPLGKEVEADIVYERQK